MQKLWRFVGFDDSFKSLSCKKAHLVGCITAGCRVEGFLYTEIEVDGLDVTEKIVKLINSSKYYRQVKCIMLYGITFAGMNIADIVEIFNLTGKPVLTLAKKYTKSLKKPAEKAGKADIRMKILKKAGNPINIDGIKVQIAGCTLKDAEEYIRISRCNGKIPECLRVAHLVASAIAHGESKKV
ncbi:MAG: DUF99 domain-containing protein [Archaeoglobus sp.]|jgi:endonuclease V-like protein UPF0215 family|nr:MAG: DUF99 domain-containing protein [Archaeoglobus sp.]